MNKSAPFNAWLEGISDTPCPVPATCSLGRAESNYVILKDKKASRNHALIHVQGGEYWLVDFGSTNGTLVNGRRVTLPTPLRNGDRLMIGDTALTFHHEAGQGSNGGARPRHRPNLSRCATSKTFPVGC